MHASPSDVPTAVRRTSKRSRKQMSRKVKKRRKIEDDGFEEYPDYIFPADDESAATMTKLLQIVYA